MRPGVVSKDAEGKINCKPIRSKIVSLLAEKNQLKFAVPGGLIGVGTCSSFPLSFRTPVLTSPSTVVRFLVDSQKVGAKC